MRWCFLKVKSENRIPSTRDSFFTSCTSTSLVIIAQWLGRSLDNWPRCGALPYHFSYISQEITMKWVSFIAEHVSNELSLSYVWLVVIFLNPQSTTVCLWISSHPLGVLLAANKVARSLKARIMHVPEKPWNSQPKSPSFDWKYQPKGIVGPHLTCPRVLYSVWSTLNIAHKAWDNLDVVWRHRMYNVLHFLISSQWVACRSKCFVWRFEVRLCSVSILVIRCLLMVRFTKSFH